jgi:tryptophan synthase beta chain
MSNACSYSRDGDSVTSGSRTLKDAMNEAMRDWVRTCRDSHYLLGSVGGPHPFPMLVRDFQAVIGREARNQFQLKFPGQLPDYAVACVGGGSNAAGLFSSFAGDVPCIGVEAGGISPEPGQNCSTLTYGRPGIFHGSLSYLLQDGECQVREVHSISAGLDYPGVGPEHSYWKEELLVEYAACTDREALEACMTLSRTEGIIPALESSHALGYVLTNADRFQGKKVIVNLSGRGDKDMGIIFKEANL